MNHNFLSWLRFGAVLLALAVGALGQGIQTVMVTADTEVCPDSMDNPAMVADLGQGAVYTWTVQGGTIQTGQGTRMITYSVGQAASAVVSLDATAGGMQYQGSATVQIGPPATIETPPVAVAFTFENEATGPSGNDLTYFWTVSGQGVIQGSRLEQTLVYAVSGQGTVTLTLDVTDASGCQRTATAMVTIDQAPVAVDDRALTSANRPVDVPVLANDTDNDDSTLTVTSVGMAQFGTVMIINGTAVRYTPNGPAVSDSFVYTVSDPHGATDTATVRINDLFTVGTGDFHGLAVPAPNTVSENARHGFIRVTVGRSGRFTGYLILAGVRRSFAGTFDANGVAQFTRSSGPVFVFARRTGQTPVGLSLQLAPGADSDRVAGSISESGAPFASIDAARAASTVIPHRYTYAFLHKTGTNRGLTADKFPQGDGFAYGAVAKGGLVSLRGRLGDFALARTTGLLTTGDRWPMYMSLYGGEGSISGWINFRPVSLTSDADATDLDWYRPALPSAGVYKEGWPGGIGVGFIGSTFVASTRTSFLPTLSRADADGNLVMQLRGGGLPPGPVFDAFNLSTANVLSKVPPNPRRFHDVLMTPVGLFTATFRIPGTTTDIVAKGAILQKLGAATGAFLNRPVVGSVTLNPQDHPPQSP